MVPVEYPEVGEEGAGVPPNSDEETEILGGQGASG